MGKQPTYSRQNKATSAKNQQTRGKGHNGRKGHVRIIGGTLKRSQLEVLDSPGLRPTPDRVRETLFNWIGYDIQGARVLDLFAGSGALSIEAISRGASLARIMEANREAAELIMRNGVRLKIADKVEILQGDALIHLRTSPAQPFDLVFVDPPFHQELISQTIELLEAQSWLADNALIYIESESSASLHTPHHWTLLRETRAGESLGRLYQRSVISSQEASP